MKHPACFQRDSKLQSGSGLNRIHLSLKVRSGLFKETAFQNLLLPIGVPEHMSFFHSLLTHPVYVTVWQVKRGTAVGDPVPQWMERHVLRPRALRAAPDTCPPGRGRVWHVSRLARPPSPLMWRARCGGFVWWAPLHLQSPDIWSLPALSLPGRMWVRGREHCPWQIFFATCEEREQRRGGCQMSQFSCFHLSEGQWLTFRLRKGVSGAVETSCSLRWQQNSSGWVLWLAQHPADSLWLSQTHD